MQYYPIYLNITNKRCVIVGGGEVGERKANRLFRCGARVVIVDRDLTPSLKGMKDQGVIEHVAEAYSDKQLEGACLVIGATDDQEVNRRISQDAKARGILVNIVDDSAHCEFILPSLIQRGDLAIALSTGGKSPALAKKLREDLEESIGPEYAVLLRIMGDIRELVIARGGSSGEHKKVFTALVNSPILCHIRERNWVMVREVIRNIAGLDMDIRSETIKE